MPSRSATPCAPGTSVHARFPPTHLNAETRMHMGLSCVEACSERACKTDILVGSGDQACLSAATLSLLWAAPTSPGEIIGKTDCNMRDFVYK
jgi:hypothetical protein